MTIVFPRDFPDEPFNAMRCRFDREPLGALSRSASGSLAFQEFVGGGLWRALYETKPLKESDYSRWHAWKLSMRGASNTFKGYDPRHCWPRAYGSAVLDLLRAGGAPFDGTVTVTAVSGEKISLSGLPANFTFMVGDYISFEWLLSQQLVKVLEDTTASAAGIITDIPIDPWLRTGGEVPATGTIVRPWCYMKIVPGSWSGDRASRFESVSFEAIQDLGTQPRTINNIVGEIPAMINMAPGTQFPSYSDFTSARWDLDLNVTVSTGFNAPDATTTGQKLVETTANGEHRMGVGIAEAGPLTPIVYRFAVIAKAAERSRIVMFWKDFANAATATASVGFNLSTGEVGYDNVVGANAVLDAATITALGGGWWLCVVDAHYGAGLTYGTGTLILEPVICIDNGTGTGARSISYTGEAGKGVYLWWFSLLPREAWDIKSVLFEDEFDSLSTIDLGNTKAPGYKWYINNLFPNSSMPTFGWHTNPPSAPSIPTNFTIPSPSILKIYNPAVGQTGWLSQMWTVVNDGANGYRGQAFRAPLLWDGFFAWDGDHSTFNASVAGIQAFWGASVEALTNKVNPSKHFLEWDVNEAFLFTGTGPTGASGASGAHDWYNPASPTSTTTIGAQRLIDNAASLYGPMTTTNFHRITGLWLNEASTNSGWGVFQIYVDGTYEGIGPYNLRGPFSQSDGHSLPVFVNSGENTHATNPTTHVEYFIDWVRVYGFLTTPAVYAFWNFYDKNADISINNDKATIIGKTTIGTWAMIRAHVGKSSGKWYWELTLSGPGIGGANGVILGIVNETALLTTGNFPGSSTKGAGAQYNVALNTHVSGVTGDTASVIAWADTDVIGFAFDADAGKVYIHKNGTWVTGAPSGGASVWSGFTGDIWYPAGAFNGSADTITANFGRTAFAYNAPSGYSALSVTVMTPTP